MTITTFELTVTITLMALAFLLGACAVAGGLASDWVLRRAYKAARRHRAKMRNRGQGYL